MQRARETEEATAGALVIPKTSHFGLFTLARGPQRTDCSPCDCKAWQVTSLDYHLFDIRTVLCQASQTRHHVYCHRLEMVVWHWVELLNASPIGIDRSCSLFLLTFKTWLLRRTEHRGRPHRVMKTPRARTLGRQHAQATAVTPPFLVARRLTI
jgi:hypothetical protein